MKIENKRIRGFLLLLLIAQSVNTLIFFGLKVAQAKLGNYIYEQTAALFLTQGQITHRDLPPAVINKLLKK